MGYVSELRALVGPRPIIVPGSVVLIFDQEHRLLLQHRKDNKQWGLIGGSMEIGESLEETAKREALEETGLEVDVLQWFGLFSGKELIYEYPNHDVVVNVVAVYTTQRFRGELKVNKKEASSVCFFSLKELPTNLSPPDKPIIEKYLHSLE